LRLSLASSQHGPQSPGFGDLDGNRKMLRRKFQQISPLQMRNLNDAKAKS
jgi:hypothetical protein